MFRGVVPAFSNVNLSGRYRISDRFEFGFDVSNLLNDEHYEAFGGDIMSRRALGFFGINW